MKSGALKLINIFAAAAPLQILFTQINLYTAMFFHAPGQLHKS